MAKLWGGRFSKDSDKLMEDFHSSISFDQKLYYWDIQGSIAHATMLGNVGVITKEEAATLVQQAVHPDALTIFGAAFDETLDDEIRVTVIATGFDEAQQAANAAAVTQPAQTENSGAPQPLDEVKGEQGQDEMDKSFDEILRIFNKDKF